jgi:hypothetical protein
MVWGLAISAFSLPLSVFLVSVGQFIMVIHWLTAKPVIQRWEIFRQETSLWLISAFYLVHLLWLFNTTDFTYAFHDLKIKLPFLIIPLVVGTSEPLGMKSLKKIILAFCLGVFISSIYSTFKIYTIAGDPLALGKEISPFVSHIRLALMVDFAILALLWMIKTNGVNRLQYLYLALIVWFCCFQVILQSLTGIVVFLTIASIYTLIIIVKSNDLMLRWFLCIILLLFVLLPSTYLVHTYTRFFKPLPIDTASLDKYTQNGNLYWHDIHSKYIENANYTYLYICDKELQPEWEKRSKLGYNNPDSAGHQIKFTLFRYLSSRGLRKDSAGLAQLSDRDIKNIENGVANVMYTGKNGITPRVYRLMWELYHYNLGANPTGYSVAQRCEYLKTAFRIIRKNLWFGTGTGDVKNAFQHQYQLDNSQLNDKWRLRAHNQLVTFLLSFGVFGLIIILASIFIPPILEKRYSDYLFLSFFLVFLLSVLNEDTLETHAGISFIAIFYSIFLYSKKDYKPLVVGKQDIEIGK